MSRPTRRPRRRIVSRTALTLVVVGLLAMLPLGVARAQGRPDPGGGAGGSQKVQTLSPNGTASTHGDTSVQQTTYVDPSTGLVVHKVTVGVHNNGGSAFSDGGSTAGGGPGGGGCPGALITYGQITEERSVTLPEIHIGAAPNTFGVTGAPTWFWAIGYNGGQPQFEPIRAHQDVFLSCVDTVTGTRSAPHLIGQIPITVIADIWPAAYTWVFGDENQPLLTSNGKPATQPLVLDCNNQNAPSSCTTGLGSPHGSSISHTYEVSSGHLPSGYQVMFIMDFRVQLTINGAVVGEYIVPHVDYARDYVVREVESLVTH